MTVLEPSVCVMRAPAGAPAEMVAGPGGAPVGGGGVPALARVARWSGSVPATPADYSRTQPLHAQPVFLHDQLINDRFAIWQGDISTLEVDAITSTTDETLMESNAVTDRIMRAAGPDLKEEIITRGHECRTGETVVTPGFQLRSRHVLHTVCPKYVAKYHTAAETSLHNCYKNVLYKAGEMGVRTLALCIINTPRRNFPPDLAAHVALRTIRRYLEQNSVPALVIIASTCGPSVALLSALAPLYFPRSGREADAARWRLGPALAAGPRGEPDHLDRRIRIIHNPHENTHTAEDSCSLYEEDAAVEAAALFARACAPDTQRLLAPPASARTNYTDRRLLDDHDQAENADILFPSDEETTATSRDCQKKSKKRTKPSSGGGQSTSKDTGSAVKKTKHDKATVKDLFGSDSDEDSDDYGKGQQSPPATLTSYVTRRVANGHARQVNEHKAGSHYIELKIYKCDEIDRVPAMNRWRQAIITVKNRSDLNTEAWRHITSYVSAVRKEFKKCPASHISPYF